MSNQPNHTRLSRLLPHLTNLTDISIVCFGLFIGVPMIAAGALYVITDFRPHLIHAYLLIPVIGVLTIVSTMLTITSVTYPSRKITRGFIAAACVAVVVWNYWVVVLLPATIVASTALLLMTLEWLLQKRVPRELSWFGNSDAIHWRVRGYRLAGVLGFIGLPLFCGCLWHGCGMVREQWTSPRWPTAQARVVQCRLAGEGCWRPGIEMRYEFAINDVVYFGSRDGVIWEKGIAYHRNAAQRVEELSGNGPVTVFYHPEDPTECLLSPGLTYEPLLWILSEAHLLALFFASWLLLLASRRKDCELKIALGPTPASVLVATLIVSIFAKLAFIWPDPGTSSLVAWCVLASAAVYASAKRVHREGETWGQAEPIAAAC